MVGVMRSLRLRVVSWRLLAMMPCLSCLVALNRLGRILAWTHLHSVVCWCRLTITRALVSLVGRTFLPLTLLSYHSSSRRWSSDSTYVEISFPTSCGKSFWMLVTMIWTLECNVLLLSVVTTSLRSWRRRRDLLQCTCLWSTHYSQMYFILISLLILGCCLDQCCLDIVCLVSQRCWTTFRIDFRWMPVRDNLILK